MGTIVETHIYWNQAASAECQIYNEGLSPQSQFTILKITVGDVEHCLYFTSPKSADALARAATAINEAIAALARET